MKILQRIKQAFSSSPGNDNSAYPRGQATYSGKVTDFNRLLPYGLASLEPEGYFVLLLNSQSQEAVKFGIPSAMQNRLKGLSQGEVAIYNSLTGKYVKLSISGDADINTNLNIDGNLDVSGDANIDGNVTIGGNLTVVGTITAPIVTASTSMSVNGKDLEAHTHSQANDSDGDSEQDTGGML